MYACYRKIAGNWCVMVTGEAKPGDVIDVTTRDGRVKPETLGAQVGVLQATADGQMLPVFALVAKERPKPIVAQIGDLSGVLALFDKAKQHLKFPSIVLAVPAINETIRINVAGDQAKVPGSLNIVSLTATDPRGRKMWYGRVLRDGNFEQSGYSASVAVVDRLIDLAKDPAKVAAEHGKLTGRCCFCNLPLTDERSTAVGYGKTCANHFGLAWGDRPEEFAAKPTKAKKVKTKNWRDTTTDHVALASDGKL